MKERVIIVNDTMQHNYRYVCTAPIGKQFAAEFKPDLTPKEMLALGIFGGKYMTDCKKEFPANWFTKAKLSPVHKDPTINYFGVDASQSLAVWRAKGWIYTEDPRGWFQWYCRKYIDARTAEHARASQKAASSRADSCCSAINSYRLS